MKISFRIALLTVVTVFDLVCPFALLVFLLRTEAVAAAASHREALFGFVALASLWLGLTGVDKCFALAVFLRKARR